LAKLEVSISGCWGAKRERIIISAKATARMPANAKKNLKNVSVKKRLLRICKVYHRIYYL
jgi:hypothetical protein